jgi:uncharacterized protein
MVHLLDVNVLLALLDPYHVAHDNAHHWFERRSAPKWATCAITQNGYMRIASQSRYSNPQPTSIALMSLAKFIQSDDHVFWPDSISLLDPIICDSSRLNSAGQITDTYLLALAKHYSGKLVTFDSRLILSAVLGGADHFVLIS